jgi:hypothetical protein
MRCSLTLLFLYLLSISFGQIDSLSSSEPDKVQDLIEDFVQGVESDFFDFNTLLEELEVYRRNPIDLNSATYAQLSDLAILSDIQITNLLVYRQELGNLLSIYELQAIPAFDLQAIRMILPFVKVSGDPFMSRIPISKMLSRGLNEFYIRTGRIIETRRGFTAPEDPTSSRYLGDPFDHFVRYRHTFENRLSYGFTAQKDPGEEFFSGSNRAGFDFYSAHLFIRNYNSRIKALALGDFRVSFGQGLLIHSGFGARKSAFVMNIKRGGETLRQYTSLDENNFMRGIGATLSLNKHLELTMFASYKGRDANVIAQELEDVDDEVFAFSSILSNGLHRTPREIDNKNAIKHLTLGSRLQYDKNTFQIGGNILYDRFNLPFSRTQQPYNQFQFSGNRLLSASVDYTKIVKNLHFFGETAISDNRAIASVNGLMTGLDRKIDVALFHRFLPRNYHSILPNVFAETAQATNEHGLYLGVEIRPDKYWRLSAYGDLWRHPWLRFQVNAPSRGYEYFFRTTYTLKRKADIYFQYRVKTRERNASDIEGVIKSRPLVDHSRQQFRIQINHKVNKELEFRNRLEYVLYGIGEASPKRGFMIYQDIIYKPMRFPLALTGRVALFDTEDYDSRIYTYENDVLYRFSVPVLYNQGMRYYVNLRYRGIRNLSLEFRISQTYYTNQDTIGSGLDIIEGNTRTDWTIQAKYSFTN